MDPPLETNGGYGIETYTKEEDGHGGRRWSPLTAPERQDEELW